MIHLHKDRPATWYPKPDGIEQKKIDKINGLIVNDALPIVPAITGNEYFVEGNLPRLAAPKDYTKDGKTLIPASYTKWWNRNDNFVKRVAALEPAVQSNEFRILSPANGTVAYLDPDLPSGGQRFPLKTSLNQEKNIQWSSESLDIEVNGGRKWLVLKPGTHYVVAQDKNGVIKQQAKIVVENL